MENTENMIYTKIINRNDRQVILINYYRTYIVIYGNESFTFDSRIELIEKLEEDIENFLERGELPTTT